MSEAYLGRETLKEGDTKHRRYSALYQLFCVKQDETRQLVTKYRRFYAVNYSFNTGNIHSKIGQIVTKF